MKTTLRDALNDRGYTTLTPVQEAVLDPDYTGKDLLVSAQTGSGKTLGFGLAIAPVILGEAEHFDPAAAPLALVIAPTRELALQVKRELSWLFAKSGAHLASCVGGMDMRDERRALARGAHIVVATPGRLRDHIMRGSIDLGAIRSVVLDEADEMLDLGFREDLEYILSEAPNDRQTLLFSATVPKPIVKLAESYQKDALRVVTKSETPQHADITYHALMVAERDTENAVINTLLFHKAPNAIVFGNTRAMVARMTTRLSNRGFQVVALSGELSQSERTHALQAMRDGRAQVCVATDVAARGIDLPNLDLVVHAELPSNHETLLHRSGRTGRAGRKGVSALIVTKKSRKKAERILSMAKLRAEWSGAPSADEVNAREEERMFADPTWTTPVEASEEAAVERLQAGFSPSALAAAYLRLYRSVRSTPEELSDFDAPTAPRPEFGPSVWFSVTGGRDAGAEPRRLLPMLCKTFDLNKDDIGAIRIRQSESFVQILTKSVPAALQATGARTDLEADATMTRLAEPPSFEKSKRSAPTAPRRTKSPEREKPLPPKAEKASSAPPEQVKPSSSAPEPAAIEKPRVKAKEKRPSTKPIDWNDEPTPRQRKPKPHDRAKQSTKGNPKTPHRGKSQSAKPGGQHPPKRRTGDGETFALSGSTAPGKKGPPPPSGKPSSKKNRARAAAAKNAAQADRKRPSKPRNPKS